MAAGGTSTFILTGVGSTEALRVPPPNNVMHHLQRNLHPTIWGFVSAGASLTWQIDCSPDGANWFPLKGFTSLTVSKFNQLSGYVYAIRGTVTVYTSGTFTLFALWSL